MHPDVYLVVHQQREGELARELELHRAAQDCPGCIVHPRRGALAGRVRAYLTGRVRPAAEVCCAS
ncbi:hypothetical protein [Cellulomonas taurus]|uniref:hypothetical protein n=1 Tax=Cellulomonas taurus TaxID=2729175 RepID=UPI00145E134F|nr:hypothetical protein [Cellulomonas taurus]